MHCQRLSSLQADPGAGSRARRGREHRRAGTTIVRRFGSGLLLYEDDEAESAIEAFVTAIAKHRHFAREMDPPPV